MKLLFALFIYMLTFLNSIAQNQSTHKTGYYCSPFGCPNDGKIFDFAGLKYYGLKKEISDFKIEKHRQTSWKLFYVIALDGLCY